MLALNDLLPSNTSAEDQELKTKRRRRRRRRRRRGFILDQGGEQARALLNSALNPS